MLLQQELAKMLRTSESESESGESTSFYRTTDNNVLLEDDRKPAAMPTPPQRKPRTVSEDTNGMADESCNFRQHVDKWYNLPENVHWKGTAFRPYGKYTRGGKEARNRLKDFVWARLTEEERDSFGGDASAGAPNNKAFNRKINDRATASRGKVVAPTCVSAPKGALNGHSASRKADRSRKLAAKNPEKHKAASLAATQKHRRKTREVHFAKRASQHYPEFSSGQPFNEIALDLISKPLPELGGMSTRQYQEDVGPGQYFLTALVTDNERSREAFALWTNTSRVYPAIMKNPAEHLVQERLVDQDEVKSLGLERFTFPELTAMGWKWLPLMEADLEGSPTLRPLYALEQQCQVLTHDLRLGTQRNNRVPGAGIWNQEVTKRNRFGVVGFAYAPPGWLNKYYSRIAFVNGKNEFTQPEVARMSLRGANETMSGVGAL